ncbi:sugar phosphate isomerase/epimerase family protein [Sciscionella sediminilitoris]|uniref:sugar phosphate isomerase/epimerase family protein n=1 Tax=Sciscionella sediminilitoris TaxID=1445613 RepID=UPI0004DECC02|nr:sugar phosphate isomerase/epimerase [Sciscionella sp. SE31]
MIPIGLSTASVWPRRAEAGFRYAAELGYDGVEVMVWGDQDSQDSATLRRYLRGYGMPVLSLHSPSLLITQRVWSPDPTVRLRRSVELAAELDCPTVVVHPPFVWQRRYAKRFPELVAELSERTGIAIAVENMFPAKPLRNVAVHAFHPSIDPTDVGYADYTLDLSHTAAAGMNALELAARMGTGLRHVHLADGTGLPRDEHLIPGRGTQPCGELLDTLSETGFPGSVIIEVSTRTDRSDAERTTNLAEALLYTKLHLAR